jgi:hypothetical protein
MFEADEFDIVAVGRAMISNANWCDLIQRGQWREARPYAVEILAELL